MANKPQKIFRLCAVFLSITFAALLLPAIVGENGLPMSLLYTSLGIAVIWIVFFAICHLVNWAVDEEIKRRALAADRNGGHQIHGPGDQPS